MLDGFTMEPSMTEPPVPSEGPQEERRDDFDQLRRARDYYRQNHPEEVPPPICPQCGLVGIERMPPTQCKYPACGPGCLYEIGRKP